jgi:hypothetical protein
MHEQVDKIPAKLSQMLPPPAAPSDADPVFDGLLIGSNPINQIVPLNTATS